ncbi:MAG: hypothetical protein R2708_04445 [Vicinamibacterales bacterium]
MPILVRPVREQLEHDRIIRLLQVKYQKKHDPVANVGSEPPTSIVIGTAEFTPDLILLTADKARKLDGVVEVETGESVNSLETLAQWVPFSKLRVPFHLYVPPHTLDTVRRLMRDHNVTVAELWTFHAHLDQIRFTLIQKAPDAAIAAAKKAGLSGTPKLKVAPPRLRLRPRRHPRRQAGRRRARDRCERRPRRPPSASSSPPRARRPPSTRRRPRTAPYPLRRLRRRPQRSRLQPPRARRRPPRALLRLQRVRLRPPSHPGRARR